MIGNIDYGASMNSFALSIGAMVLGKSLILYIQIGPLYFNVEIGL